MKLRRHGAPVIGAPWVLMLAASMLLGAGSAHGQVDGLRSDLDRILRGTGWRSAEWGVLAVSLDAGDTLFAWNPGRPLVPASNVKLLTTAAALHYLGADFRYQTFVLTTGPLDDEGRLHGDLILYGTGDPGLSDRFHDSRVTVFELLADELLAAGIRDVDGRVLGDGTFFRGPLLHEGWDPRDLNDWFAAPSSALSFNENVVTLRIEAAARDGDPPVVHTTPELAGLPIDNQARTGRGPRLRIERAHPSYPIEVMGTMVRGQRDIWRRLTVRDPARYAAQAFLNVLAERGMEVRGGVGTVREGGSAVTGHTLWAPAAGGETPRVLARHVSPPLLDYLSVVNKQSHNLLADIILKTVGRVAEGDGSFSGGSRAVRRFLEDEVGASGVSFNVLDGSGLTAANRVPPGLFVQLLAYMSASEHWADYWSTLPEAGNRRELGRMFQTAAAGNLRAKTGTIDGVSALSGVVRSASGESIAFSIIGNRVPSTWSAKRVEDRIGARLASFQRPAVLAAQADGLVNRAAPGAMSGPDSEASPISLPPDAPAASGTADMTRYQVARGESFAVIARRYGIPLGELLAANRGIEPERLQAGAWIVVPASARRSP